MYVPSWLAAKLLTNWDGRTEAIAKVFKWHMLLTVRVFCLVGK